MVISLILFACITGRETFTVPEKKSERDRKFASLTQDPWFCHASAFINVREEQGRGARPESVGGARPESVGEKLRTLGSKYNGNWNQCCDELLPDGEEGSRETTMRGLQKRLAAKDRALRDMAKKVREISKEADPVKAHISLKSYVSKGCGPMLQQSEYDINRTLLSEGVSEALATACYEGLDLHSRQRFIEELIHRQARDHEQVPSKDSSPGGINFGFLSVCCRGYKALQDLNLSNLILTVAKSAADHADRWINWKLMPELVTNWTLAMEPVCTTKVRWTAKWLKYCDSLYALIGGGNSWKFIRGPGNQASDNKADALNPKTFKGNMPFPCRATMQGRMSQHRTDMSGAGFIEANMQQLLSHLGGRDRTMIVKEDLQMLNSGYPGDGLDGTGESDMGGFGGTGNDLKDRQKQHQERKEMFQLEEGVDHSGKLLWLERVRQQVATDKASVVQKCSNLKLKLDRKRAEQIRECRALGHTEDYDTLKYKPGLGQIFKDNKYVKATLHDLDKGGDLQEECDNLVKVTESITNESDETTRAAHLEDLQEALQSYNERFYKTVTRLCAHNALVIMVCDHQRTFALPVFVAYLHVSATSAVILDLVRVVQQRLFNEGCKYVVGNSYDGQMAAEHRWHGTQPLNKLQLRKHCEKVAYTMKATELRSHIVGRVKERYGLDMRIGDLLSQSEGINFDMHAAPHDVQDAIQIVHHCRSQTGDVVELGLLDLLQGVVENRANLLRVCRPIIDLNNVPTKQDLRGIPGFGGQKSKLFLDAYASSMGDASGEGEPRAITDIMELECKGLTKSFLKSTSQYFTSKHDPPWACAPGVTASLTPALDAPQATRQRQGLERGPRRHTHSRGCVSSVQESNT